MNKIVTIVVVVLVLLVGGGAYFIVQTKGSNGGANSQEVKTGASAYAVVDACDVLTQKIADKVLGAPSTKAGVAADSKTSTKSLSVSNCTYSYRSVTTGPAIEQGESTKRVSLLVRAAKDKAGADSNKGQFNKIPAGSQSVSGYGDAAFWDPKFGQLNILKDNNWYILNHSKGITITGGTLDEAKQLADALKDHLK